jgi:hypothetical protein
VERTITIVFVVAAPGGGGVVVLNDASMFHNEAMEDIDNVRFVENLVVFTSVGPRNAGTVVVMDRGRSSPCGLGSMGCSAAELDVMGTTIENRGFTITEISSTSGSLTSIASNVKVVFLWLPRVEFTVDEINALKAFAASGGRIVFLGEWSTFYGVTGFATQNRFLEDMGAVMRSVSARVDCPTPEDGGFRVLPASSLRPSTITQGLSQLKILCSSILELGLADFPLFLDTSNTHVLAAVAAIDVTPLVATP